MFQNNKTIKFFISSTFKDFIKERNALQTFVFPRLKQLCQKDGFSFQPVDLRWGVTDESSEDNQTMNFCLNEVERCSYEPKPSLLILIGQRYGWGPLPSSITKQQWKHIKKKLPTEKYIELQEWYSQDENDLGKKYFLHSKIGLAREEWAKIEKKLKSLLENATTYMKGKNKHIYKGFEHFHTSATEQEIRYEVDDHTNIDINNTFRFTREFVNGEDENLIEDSDNAKNRLQGLKDYLNKIQIPEIASQSISIDIEEYNKIDDEYSLDEEHIYPEDFPDYLKKFCENIYLTFKIKIKEEIALFHKNNSSDLKIEIEEQKRFLKFKSKVVLGREDETKDIKQFILNSQEQYYLLYGKSGSGKSAVMAKVIADLTNESSEDYLLKKCKVIYRFIGTTAHTSSPRDTYEHIYWELTNKKRKPIIEYEDHKFYIQFKELLKSYKKKKVIIFIDALDQFNSYDSLSLFLDELPSNVKVIFSTLNKHHQEDNIDTLYYETLTSSIPNTKELKILTTSNKVILESWLSTVNRTLTPQQSKYLLNQCKEKTPLYLRLAFTIAKEWKSSYIAYEDDIKGNEKDLILKFFEKLHKNHYHKTNLIEKVLGFISASRDGLSESELIELLSREEDILKNYERDGSAYPKLSKLPDAIFSRLYYHMQEFFTEKLVDSEMLITPFHRIIDETIKDEYYKNINLLLHTKLADYFLTLQNTDKVWDKRYNNLHMLSETPYQLFKSKDSQGLKEILFDLEFAGSVYDNYKQERFREIIKKATQLNDVTEDDIYIWESFYREKEHLIVKVNEKLWRPHQSLFLLAHEDGENSCISQKAHQLLNKEKVDFLWLKKRNRPNKFKRTGLIKILEGHTKSIKGVKTLKDGKILSYSYDGTLRLWSSDGKAISVLEGHTDSVSGAEILEDGRILSYSDDKTLRLWSSEGKILVVLEGHTDNITGIEILKDGRILSYSLNENILSLEITTLRLWSSEGKAIAILEEHTDSVAIAKILEDSNTLYYSKDKTVVLRGSKDKALNIVNGLTKFLNGAKTLKDGRILSYSYDGVLRLWSSEGKVLAVLEGHLHGINGVKTLKDGRILSYSYDGTLRLWSSDGKAIAVLEGHRDSVSGAEILEDGRILSFSDDKTLRLWNVEDLNLIVVEGHTGSITGAKILEDGVLSCSKDKTLRLWNTEDKTIIILEGHSHWVSGANLLKDGRILSYSRDNTLRLWSVEGEVLALLKGHTNLINGIEILEDGRILSYSRDNTLRLWNAEGIVLSVLEGHTNSVNGAKILKDGRILSYAEDNTLRLWSAKGENLAVLDGYRDCVVGAEILEDGKILSYSLREKTLKLRDVEGDRSAILEGHTGAINGAKILKDGKILSYSQDNTLRLWNTKGKIFFDRGYNKDIFLIDDKPLHCVYKALAVLKGHTDSVTGVEILKDGKILSYSKDNTLRLWSSKGKALALWNIAIDNIDFRDFTKNSFLATSGKSLFIYNYYDGKKEYNLCTE